LKQRRNLYNLVKDIGEMYLGCDDIEFRKFLGLKLAGLIDKKGSSVFRHTKKRG
jgi:hypothetical protein